MSIRIGNELQVSAGLSQAAAACAYGQAAKMGEEGNQLEQSDCRWWSNGKTDRPEC